MSSQVISVVIAGLGGQGVVKAGDILADAAFRAGYAVRKAEIHGMSQRGGSVSCDIRFGAEVFSPMAPAGTADFLVLTTVDQLEANQARVKPDAVIIGPDAIDASRLSNSRSLNVALLGALSSKLDIPEKAWDAAICAALAPKLHEANRQAFALGRGVSGD